MRVALLGTFKQGSSHLGFGSDGGTRKLWQLIWPVPAEAQVTWWAPLLKEGDSPQSLTTVLGPRERTLWLLHKT